MLHMLNNRMTYFRTGDFASVREDMIEACYYRCVEPYKAYEVVQVYHVRDQGNHEFIGLRIGNAIRQFPALDCIKEASVISRPL